MRGAARPKVNLVTARGVGRQPQHQVVRVIDSTIQAGFENGVVVQMSSIKARTRGKGDSWTDQRPARDNTIYDPVKSAKPPSPVQIRAAPPILVRDGRVLICDRDPKW